jgi:hypothetical protein
MTSTATDQITGFSGSLAVKQPVRLATLVDIVLEGLIAIDGIVPAEGDRVLVKAQATPSQNGIYIASTGVWSRAADFDATGKAVKGTQVWVTDGTTQAGTLWIVSAANPIVVDTSALTWQAGNAYQQGAAMAAAIIAATSKVDARGSRPDRLRQQRGQFSRQMTWAQMMAALLPGAAASSFVRRNAGNTAYEHRTAAQVLSDIGALPLAGGTLTGGPRSAWRSRAACSQQGSVRAGSYLQSQNGGTRWHMALGHHRRGGANAGSDFSSLATPMRAVSHTPLSISRASGLSHLGRRPASSSPPPPTLHPTRTRSTTTRKALGRQMCASTVRRPCVTYGGRSGTYTKTRRHLQLQLHTYKQRHWRW